MGIPSWEMMAEYGWSMISLWRKVLMLKNPMTQIPMASFSRSASWCLTPFFSTNGAAFRLTNGHKNGGPIPTFFVRQRVRILHEVDSLVQKGTSTMPQRTDAEVGFWDPTKSHGKFGKRSIFLRATGLEWPLKSVEWCPTTECWDCVWQIWTTNND